MKTMINNNGTFIYSDANGVTALYSLGNDIILSRHYKSMRELKRKSGAIKEQMGLENFV